ncbi:hypothetical protein [Kushneria phosphatilytica]|uniref:Ribbon-helix-helix protein, CopG family n=1 Tax=Kushneria phosphatilytica TaxID=657387 RepID=A0A5C0ZXY2_9GAMM|nr:hypothetical protein [Kushneria phosphatilytica]QEL11041.1 hypothetical protein FY550_07805 [Kushneria phosphatilytica]
MKQVKGVVDAEYAHALKAMARRKGISQEELVGRAVTHMVIFELQLSNRVKTHPVETDEIGRRMV